MPDDLTRRKPEDPNKINIHQQWEVDYWSDELGVSEQELKYAILKVGVMVADIKQFLGK